MKAPQPARQDQNEQFSSKFRKYFWPIASHELAKFVPMSALMFCILFNQNVLRILKDSILIAEVSAEVTSFVKLYCVTPLAALFVVLYAQMINHLTFDKIFYYLIGSFTAFFILFAFLLYPNIEFFHMDKASAEQLMFLYPNFKWFIAIVANWCYVIFYCFAEMWPNIFYVLLFWQLANEITTTNEAKRFYMLFSLFGNSSLILVGMLMQSLSSDNSVFNYLITTSDSKQSLASVSISFVAISSVVSCLLIRFITDQHKAKDTGFLAKNLDKKRAKMGVIDSFNYIARSKYLWLMLICTASFGLSMNLVEAVWKSKIKELYPSVTAFANFNSIYILWTGVAIMVMTIIGNNIMRTRSWFAAAVISPSIILVTGTAFFSLVVFDTTIINYFDGVILATPLALAVFVGAVQNILSKGSKYSIWDTSRQMLYIPLDHELRTKGKAAVDVISPKIGKSSSGLITSFIFVIFPSATYGSIAPLLMIIFILVCVLWIYAVRKIYFEYQKIV